MNTITSYDLDFKTTDQRFTRNYRVGQYTITISRQKGGAHFLMFEINEDNGTKRSYGGLPNMCETFQAAYMRAYHRAKWINAGTYSNHYK